MDETKKTLNWMYKPINLMLAGLFIGAFTILGLRVLLAKDHATHYHANFALYINGERDKFENFTFYEEVQSCSSEDHSNPKHRVHMHNRENDTVHVHDDGVTWGHFFANLGYGLLNDAVKNDDGVFVDGAEGKKLTFILNGEAVDSVANRPIASEDVLLVDYGDGSEVQSRFDGISKSAGEHNHKPDPASCSGAAGLSFGDRIKQALDFSGNTSKH
jgi:hypothetical protein